HPSDGKQGRKAFGNVTDTILYYIRGADYVFNLQHAEYSETNRKKYSLVDKDGRFYQLDNITGPGGAAKGNPSYEVMGVTRFWRYSRDRMDQLIEEGRVIQTRPGAVPQYKRYLDEMEGTSIQDVWTDIPPINSQAKERLASPTQ